MDILKIIFSLIGGIICIYCFFRLAALAIANSWKQVMDGNSRTECKDSNKQNTKSILKKREGDKK